MFPHPPFVNQPHSLAFDVWVSNPRLSSDLAAFLDRAAYRLERIRGDIVAVRAPATPADDLARAELEVYLRLWRRRHPSETAEIVE
jgi:hypothetical protein